MVCIRTLVKLREITEVTRGGEELVGTHIFGARGQFSPVHAFTSRRQRRGGWVGSGAAARAAAAAALHAYSRSC